MVLKADCKGCGLLIQTNKAGEWVHKSDQKAFHQRPFPVILGQPASGKVTVGHTASPREGTIRQTPGRGTT